MRRRAAALPALLVAALAGVVATQSPAASAGVPAEAAMIPTLREWTPPPGRPGTRKAAATYGAFRPMIAAGWPGARPPGGDHPDGDVGVDDFTGLAGHGRYLRLLGVTRATRWGYSLFEPEAFAAGSGPRQCPERASEKCPESARTLLDLPDRGGQRHLETLEES
ncbi:hypothetical protein [Couchioplanes azureus]|uniref:hypothetical protein n=1 Tax=Couchioplanes caeruleus TaxID=56438 RepID=UPI0016713EBF|nr:hypothetical protein [Couchioplanes caeruleus]GGQ48293.1 hypothetical protein GCM10010166_15590 [Couchioplanes caeruleus subsp. azureus]